MRNKKLENIIKYEIQENVPDVLDNILSNCKGKEFKMKKEVKSFPLKPVIAFASFIVLAVLIGVIVFNNNTKRVLDSTVYFDGNPSIEIKVDNKNKVMGANALNVDGKKILKDMDLVNTDLKVAVNAIVGSMYKEGYISELKNSILVTVDNKDENKRVNLQTELEKEINETLKTYKIESAVLTQNYDTNDDIQNKAKQYGISNAKALILEKIIASNLTNKNGKAYTYEELVDLNINELNVILDSKNKTLTGVLSTGNASTKSYIGIDKAKNIALTDAKASEANILDFDIELDYEYGLMVYEIDFDFNNQEYEYEINAITGEIINKFVETDGNIRNNPTPNQAPKTNTSNYIGRAKAKDIVLKNAGVSASNVRDLSIELDKEKGKMVYEVDFEAGNKDYEYDIDAVTGKILYKDVEIDD